jgi:hypothetical protein
MLSKTFETKAGTVNLAGTTEYHSELFGYTLFEEVIDPANPEGPKAIGMHVPAQSMSKAWLLVEPGYAERVELLEGSANLVVGRSEEADWITIPLTAKNPTGDDIEIKQGDVFCIVTDEQEATVLSRPSKPFELSFEAGVTAAPTDPLSQFIQAHLESVE